MKYKTILICICLILAFCIPADAACSKTIKQTGATCSGDTVSSCGSTCNSVNNCTNNGCNYVPTKCNKSCSKKACNYGQCKKSKCAAVNKKTCNTRRGCNVGCNAVSKRGCNTGCNTGCKNKTVAPVIPPVIPPVVPGNVSGTTTFKLCKNRVCTVGGDGKVLSLTNYKNSTDPTYDQLLKFLLNDTTDEGAYTSTYVCSDFAKKLHDNAEASGIRAGWVGVESENHAFNVFNTTDKGIVYIDCTGVPGGAELQDKELTVKTGEPLTGRYLFKSGTVNMGGEVRDLLVYW